MALDLTKKTNLKEWYFIEHDVQYGPFQLSELLDKINRETLVWCEGIEWTIAEDQPELQKYFPKIGAPSTSKENQEKDYNNEVNKTLFFSPKKMFSSPFSFNGRIRRTEYGISTIIYIIGYGLVINLTKSSEIFGLAFIPLFWFIWAQGAKRCHDRSNSGWYQIIPLYILWMIFAEGDNFENRYGQSPK